MQVTTQPKPVSWSGPSGISLADIARLLDVPVVIATNSDVSALRTHSTYGLDFGVNWSEFAAAVDAHCVKGTVIIPNIETHPELCQWAKPLAENNIRFLAGVPLNDFDGWRVGSIAVIAAQAEVARNGIPVRRLAELGRQFVGVAT